VIKLVIWKESHQILIKLYATYFLQDDLWNEMKLLVSSVWIQVWWIN